MLPGFRLQMTQKQKPNICSHVESRIATYDLRRYIATGRYRSLPWSRLFPLQ